MNGRGPQDDYFDDCALCRLLKRAEKEGREPTLEEYKEAFDETDTPYKKWFGPGF